MLKKILIVLILGLAAAALVSCQSGEKQAVAAVQAYLQALVDKNETQLVNLSCPEWQASALLEYDAFGNVGTSLQDLSCAATQVGGSEIHVQCTGNIQATYQNEAQTFDLGSRDIVVRNIGGDWLVCGY
jgi:hypothetical protein